ncbi:MAG: hypothetical protein K2X38_08425 [Gemmataceae bacterium]|nr:hypothetical protein [Gemmataceae bacterium]
MMRLRLVALLLALPFCVSFAAAQEKVASGDWPWWRGPSRDGSADPKTPPPTQ